MFTLNIPAGPTVFLADPAHIRDVFSDADVYRAGEASAGLASILGPGSSMLLDGATHLRRRRLLPPPFHGDRLRSQAQTIIDATAAEVARWPAGTTLALAPRMRAITLDVILRMVIGLGDGRRLDELRDELMTLLLAGNETTATTLAWTFALLFAHPLAYARLQEEVAAGGGHRPYRDAVCTEVLRLRPPGPNVARQLTQPATIGDHELPAGTRVAPAMYLVHRRPDSYPAPYAFRPERFLGARPSGTTWLPFGGGTRRCPGAALAQLEHRTILRTVLEHVTPRADPPVPPGRPVRSARRAVVLAPAGGVPARIDLVRR